MTTQIRYAHAGDLTTNQAHALVWNVGGIGDRYQEIAIVGDKVIGSWTYRVEWHRRRAWLDSSRTDVTPRFRRKGVARALWFAGIARWKPWKIEASITLDANDRYGLVTVTIDGEQYAIVDIGMRMLTPRELFRANGVDDDVVIDPIWNGKPITKTDQIRLCGNICPPQWAEEMIAANFGGLP